MFNLFTSIAFYVIMAFVIIAFFGGVLGGWFAYWLSEKFYERRKARLERKRYDRIHNHNR